MNSQYMEQLFGSAYRYHVLKELFGNPHDAYYLRGLATKLGLSPGTLLTMLKGMVKSGLIERTEERPHPMYRACLASPIAKELVSIFTKDNDVVSAIAAALAPMASEIEYAGIFGSFARSSARNDSDIDVLVISGQLSAIVVQAALMATEEQAKRPVNASVYTPQAWQSLLNEGSAFATSVLQSKIITLVGTETILEKRS